ncbi:exosporium leader peptide-containing protein [Bacillus wiedmannii]|uniref:exosporium leader peptide-containing protein n=1 Tax=Bacillus wiedmannii TaxID=1890302 RepID=UPI001CC1C2D5|nr:exosporium leader peptide-containing protein [Bacillus wiedmannii]
MKEKKWKKHPLFDTCLIANALNPELIGHTFAPIPSITLPTGPTGVTGPTGLMLSADNIFVANGSDAITTASFDPLPMLSTITVNGTSLTLASPGISVLTVGTYYIIAKCTIQAPATLVAAIALAVNGSAIPHTSSLTAIPFPIIGTQIMTFAIVNVPSNSMITV